MSSQNARLDWDWSPESTTTEIDPETERERVLAGGARYGQSRGRAQKNRTEVQNECLNCGEAISSEIARVVGDRNDCVPCCKGCAHDVLPRGEQAYSSTVRVVMKYRAEEGL